MKPNIVISTQLSKFESVTWILFYNELHDTSWDMVLMADTVLFYPNLISSPNKLSHNFLG